VEEKVKAVEEVFNELENEVSAFRQATKLHCIAGCGACCKKPDIEATPLEFLPFAYHLYLKGEAEHVLEKLNNNPGNTCIIFKSFPEQNINAGTCTEYRHRGLTCRLFGFSARIDKYGKPELSTCKTIKETQAEDYHKTVKLVGEGMSIPLMRDYYFRLRSVDANLTEKFFPVNLAIKQAIEYVLMYYAYR